MLVAVFGDVHGNLPGVYELCESWQDQNSQQIDLVLQTGDMGLWQTRGQMDKAAKKHDKTDKVQLRASPYISGEKTAPIETWFVHGNHENFPLLAEHEDQAVDAGGKIVFLAPGSVREFRKGGDVLRVTALGGMEYRFGKYPMPSNERVQKYLHPPALEQLRRERPEVDVLLLHDAPLNKGLRNKFPTGSKRLTELVQVLQPRFMFYGHYDDPPEPFMLGKTFCAGTNYAQAKRIAHRDGAMGILRTGKWQFTFVDS